MRINPVSSPANSSPSSQPTKRPRRRDGRFASLLGLGLLVAALLGGTGCVSKPKVVSSDGPYDLTLVLPGDTLLISFPGATNLNTSLKVPLDGEIRLPAAFGKPINATGKTRGEVEKALLAEFGSQLPELLREVNVSVVTSAAVVYVSGAVMIPNKIAMDRPLTLMEAIMEAGGPDPRRANLGNVSVVRNVDGQQKSFVLDMRAAFSGGDVTPFYLRPFDSIVVPARKFNF